METPLANAAKRVWAFIPVPIMLAFTSPNPSDCTYWRTSGPITEPEPASAKPKPSKMDFLPKSRTSAGMSSYFVLTMNSATYLVSPGALGNSAAGPGEAYACPRPNANADSAKEFLNKSRRFIFKYLQDLRIAGHQFLAAFAEDAAGFPGKICRTFSVPILRLTSLGSWLKRSTTVCQRCSEPFPSG